MEYYFNEIDATKFQRLINSILDARYGDNFRITPLRGADGGRDGETAPGNPYFEYQVSEVQRQYEFTQNVDKGRYLFQVKHHRTTDIRLTDARRTVLTDFENELKRNILSRTGNERVNYFFLITNVPSSADALTKLDNKRNRLLVNRGDLHADIWWKDQIVAFLDRMPSLWLSFPEIFAGGKVPFLADIVSQASTGLSRSIRIAIKEQFRKDSIVKFRQIGLETELSKLFVDLDLKLEYLKPSEREHLVFSELERLRQQFHSGNNQDAKEMALIYRQRQMHRDPSVSALHLLLEESRYLYDAPQESRGLLNKVVLEGGPGQGKSTITQMMVQIYRQMLLSENQLEPEGRWEPPAKVRLPLRVELRKYAEWLGQNSESSVEQYIASDLNKDSGSDQINVEHIHNMVEGSPVFLVFDGLDEIGSDELRDNVLVKIRSCIQRFEEHLSADLRVIVTTRPPAIVGRREHLADFTRLPLAPLEPQRIESYLNRWLSVHLQDKEEQLRVREAFESRRREPHVQALIKNPMQLSVLLHFIKLKDEAFPDHRAKLYKEYFQIVIDRDVAKSPELRNDRELIEGLHEFLGYKLHALTEAQKSDGTLERSALLQLANEWLSCRGGDTERAKELFKLGEDRLGLIVTARGEGQEGRYGYEIQPIREYFAAAFINKQIRGNANDIFEAMVRRPYWREVALFLAGLRRPNEKADLVTRANYLDDADDLGWRQDGRNLILQLLQEGTFSDPPHVFTTALDSVFELLNPTRVAVQNEPERLLQSLPQLIDTLSGRNRERFANKLLSLIQEFESEGDEYVIYRIYRTASRILEPTIVRQKLLSHKTESPQLLVKLRMAWPYSFDIDMEDISGTSEYWSGVPEHIWAHCWWETAILSNKATRLVAPDSLHQYLLLQFASDPLFPEPHLVLRRDRRFSSGSNWAIWQLASYYQSLQLQPETASDIEKPDSWITHDFASEINFSGLDGHSKTVVNDLITVYRDMLAATITENVNPETVLGDYAPTLKKDLQKRGALGWLTARCLTNLIGGAIRNRIDVKRVTEHRLSILLEEIVRSKGILSELLNEARQFFDRNERNLSEYGLDYFLYASRGMFFLGYPFQTPSYVRLEDNGELVAVVDLLTKAICSDKELPSDLLSQVVFTTEIIRPLVDNCKECLPRLLLKLDEMEFTRVGYGKPLTIQRINQILKISRETDDPRLLAGAFLALSTSKYIRSAGEDVILKFFSADSSHTPLAAEIFQRRGALLFSERERLDPEELRIIEKTARRILKTPQSYGFRIVCAAAEYLAESIPISLPPLLTMEEELELHV